jgi:glycosyltransferase involved in cell wall biosynthesis
VPPVSNPSLRPQETITPGRIRFSVIIPARNEEGVIGQCLERLSQLDYPREAFEVIVVDNGSTDRTTEIARSWGSALNVTVLPKRNAHISAVRNFGVASARGEFLAFLDADCLVSAKWLREADTLLSADGAGVVGAHYRIPEESSWLARAWYQDEHANRGGKTSYVPSGDLLMRRPDFLRIGGFDETLETNEDYELCQRAQAAGLPVLAFPQLEVVHLGTPQTLRAFYGKQRWHGKHVFYVFLSNLPKLQNAKTVFFTLYIFLSLAGLAAGAVRFIWSGRLGVLAVFLFGLLLALVALALRTAMARKRWAIVLPLVALNLVFGVARVACVLDPKNWFGGERDSGGEKPEPSRDGAHSGASGLHD